tara:strand:- start:2258 stop:3244 length:987 start_codon:yes stop_codon:yes gene_type:complete
MINKSQNLNPDLFNKDVEQKATREGFGSGLVLAGKADRNVVALCCDLTDSTKMNAFEKEFPNRFIQNGIQEQSMNSVASGMAAMGKIPFTSSYAMFSPGRAWEQIRTTIAYNDTNVKIVGSHAGISVGPDGGTHQALEDIAIMRCIPNMRIVYPCDVLEAERATQEIAKLKGPVYLRLAREKTPIITTDKTQFKFGKGEVYFESEGKDIKIGIIASGPLLYNALMAAKKLDEDGVGVKVMNLATIKPLPEDDILKFAKGLKGVVSVEEHQVMGGVGSALAELFAQKNPLPMKFIGVHDQFGQSGEPNELIEHYGMGITHIEEAARKLL